MSPLTRRQAALHLRACELLDRPGPLAEDDKEFVLTHWRACTDPAQPLHGAYFTPPDLARTMAVEVLGDRIIDLCAGIGTLAWGCRDLLRPYNGQPARELVCVERNRSYIDVGRRVLPEATWICGDVFDLPDMKLGRFTTAIANPPFGGAHRTGPGPRYRGPRFEYHVIDLAADIADHGVFIIPQVAAPFTYSGRTRFTSRREKECRRFEDQTGLELEANCGIDTSFCDGQWQGPKVPVEIVTCDFTEREQCESQRAA